MYLAVLFVAHLVLEPARRQLTAAQKASVMDVSAPLRAASMLPPIVLVFLYGFAAQAWPQYFQVLTFTIYAIFISAMALISILAYRRIRVLDVPALYLQRLLASQIMYISALIFLCGYLSVYYVAAE